MLTRTLSFSWSSLISAIWPGEVGERAFLDPHRLADLVLEPRAGSSWTGSAPPSALTWRMLSTSRRDSGVGLVPGPDEAGHARRVADHRPGVVVEVAPAQQVAGEDLLLDDHLLAVLELDHVLHGDDDLEDPVLHVHGRRSGSRGWTSPCSRSRRRCGRRTTGRAGRRGSRRRRAPRPRRARPRPRRWRRPSTSDGLGLRLRSSTRPRRPSTGSASRRCPWSPIRRHPTGRRASVAGTERLGDGRRGSGLGGRVAVARGRWRRRRSLVDADHVLNRKIMRGRRRS